ncbi:ATP-dependent Clp protease proteolytic subunit [Phormidium sp. CLA17]|nr:ATP-dependent Clp protease proteolytic subunit [Leptolyngbya sp. Cla-17]
MNQTETPKAAPSESDRDTSASVDEWLSDERIVFVSGEIVPEMAEAVIAQLLYFDSQAPGKDIYLYINSSGGEVTAGLSMYDTMRSLRSNVVTVCLGEASSMASILLAGGTKGKRLALPNSRIMIHQPSTGVQGLASDIAIEAKEILYLRGVLNRLLVESTGQPLKRIETDTDRDFFMSAEQAKAYGIIDQVIKKLPSASHP